MLDKRPTYIKIKLKNLINNLEIIKKIIKKNTEIIAVVKANAYGHGSEEVTKELFKHNVKYFAVACAYEAEKLFNLNLNLKIVSIGKIYREDIELSKKFPYELTVSSINDLNNIKSINFPLNIHLKIDTGMGRCGVWSEEFISALKIIKSNGFLNLKGVLTHFPAADNDLEFTKSQIKILQNLRKFLYENKFVNVSIHCANSDAIINFPEAHFDMVRPGIILYGSYWNLKKKKELGLKPVMEFISKVVEIKTFKKGDTIGYGRTFTVEKDNMKCALIPAGYADGFSRAFSNNGFLLINNHLCEIVGRISMDWLVVNINNKDIKIGDKVILFGDEKRQVDIDIIANKINTISYEILCNVGKNYRKEVVYDRGN